MPSPPCTSNHSIPDVAVKPHKTLSSTASKDLVTMLSPLVKVETEERKEKTENASEQPPLQESALLPEQLRTVALCANHRLGESGLSRKIVAFYKDLMSEEVFSRIEEIGRRISATIDAAQEIEKPWMTLLLQELVLYMQHYCGNLQMIKRIFILLKQAAHDNAAIRPVIVQHSLCQLLATTKRYPDELCLLMVVLLRNLLSPTQEEEHYHWSYALRDSKSVAGDWKNTVVDMVLEANCQDLILQTAHRERMGDIVIVGCERLVAYFSGNLSKRPSLKHNMMAMDFIVARLQFKTTRVQACFHEPGIDRYRTRR